MLRIIIVVVVFGLALGAHGQVLINEIQSSNGSTSQDEDGDNEDWIELYNAGDEPVNLNGFWLSDDYENPSRWVIPDVTIGAGETLLVWASGKNRNDPSSPLHTDFGISAGGEEILFSAPNGELLDEVPPLLIPTDVSWGRLPDGADHWAFFNEPTPGSVNASEGYSEVLESPTFSAPGGFYESGFDLTISHPDPSVTIIYTTDGSLPALDSVGGVSYQYKNQYRQRAGDIDGELLTAQFESHIYSSEISIEDRSSEPNRLSVMSSTYNNVPHYFPTEPVFKGTVVRAVAVKEGAITSPVITHTYFITDQGENPFDLPVISLGLQEDDLFGYEHGIYVAGVHFDQWRDNNPDAASNNHSRANWHQRGRDWERASHLEFYEPGNKQADFKQDIGIRLHGGATRIARRKSFRIYARSEYGESRFNYQFFPDMPDDSFNRLLLRNSGNDHHQTLFRDAMIQALGEGLRVDTQAYRPSVTFVNGEYWGILNIRERYDRHYLARTYGVDPNNIDYLNTNNSVVEGSAVHYVNTTDFMADNSMSVDANFEEVQTRVDTDNFMDYNIANIYANNTDWPGNNIDYWRLRTDAYKPDAPEGHDGRWRWMWFDADVGFALTENSGGVSNDALTHAILEGTWSRFMLRNLLENEGFRSDFINRFADLLNTNFSSEHVVSVINRMKAVIESEMGNHIQRWNGPESLAQWHANVDVMLDFARARPDYQRQHLRSFFGLGNEYVLTLDAAEGQGSVRVNSITINEDTIGVVGDAYPWSGRYFDGVPIELEAIPAPGYEFSHWTGLPEGTPAVASLESPEDVQVTAHFVAADNPFLHAWLFDNDLANNTPLERVEASISYGDTGQIVFHSALAGYPFHEDHELWRSASMERRNRPTPINYLMPEPFGESNMRGLQVTQPFLGDGGENTLIFELPTTGQSHAVFSFAAMDEGAVESLLIDYSVSEGTPQWTAAGLSQTLLPLSDEFQLYNVDFSEIDAVDNNPHFQVRMRFVGADMTIDEGDRVTFNNFSLQSVPSGSGDDDDDGDEPGGPGEPAPPANNRFADAQILIGTSGIATGTTESATIEAGEPDHSQASGEAAEHSVWWTWQAQVTERMTFAADSSSAVSLYTGNSLETLKPVVSDYSGSSEVLIVAQAGETYRIAVSSIGGAQGEIALTWDKAEPAATPQVFENNLGESSIICEVADCELVGNDLRVNATDAAVLISLPNQEEGGSHTHQLQQLDDAGEPIWGAEFSTGLPGVQSRIIADTQGLPVIISQLTLANDNHYQVEAYSDGVARHRILSSEGELLRVHLAIPGSSTELHSDGRLTAAAPLPGRDLRVLLEVSSAGRLLARYQQRNGEQWQNHGDVLTDTEFPEGAIVVVTRENGSTLIQIDTQIENDLHF